MIARISLTFFSYRMIRRHVWDPCILNPKSVQGDVCARIRTLRLRDSRYTNRHLELSDGEVHFTLCHTPNMHFAIGTPDIIVKNASLLKKNHYCLSAHVGSDEKFNAIVDTLNTFWERNYSKLLIITWKFGNINFSLMLEKKHVRRARLEKKNLYVTFNNGKKIEFDQFQAVSKDVKRIIMKHEDGWIRV